MGRQHKEREDFNLVQLNKGIEIVEGNDVFRHFVLRICSQMLPGA